MSKHHAADVHNLALVGHGASGKTSLADALLFKAKIVDRRGSVDDGTSVSDYDDEAKKRHHTLDANLLFLESHGKRLHLIDTPGFPDFIGQALCGLSAVENAIVVVNAHSGIEVNTRRMFNEAAKLDLARFIVINKIDSDNVKFQELMEIIRATFGGNCVLFNVPVGVSASFSGVVDVLEPPASVPAGLQYDLELARAQLVEAAVEADETLMEKYLAEGAIANADLLPVLPKAIAEGKVIPIFCTSAKKDIGISELLTGLEKFALAPAEGHKHKFAGADGKAIVPDEKGDVVGLVFKVLNDKFIGTLSFVRVFSGTITNDMMLHNARTGKTFKAHGLLEVQGKTTKPIAEAVAGDLFALAKVEDLHFGDTITSKPNLGKVEMLAFPTPMFGLAVEPKARGDEQKISGSLAKMADEDPTFKVTRDTQTKELVIHGMSQLHLDVVQSRLKRRFDLEVVTHEPKIPYRETITANGEGQHRHKKQTGGAGQFGEVHLRVYPMPPGVHDDESCRKLFMNKEKFAHLREDHSKYDASYNFAFVDHIVGGTIPNQFMPAVHKGCLELLERGAVAGYRLQDIGVEVYFGKDHPVDSKEVAFKTAARVALKNAIMAARPAILEPIVNLEVTVPSKYTGTILGDLNTRRGRIENQDSLPGDLQVIKAKVPLAEVTRYKATLDSITQGQGAYTMEFSHYDPVPGNVQQQIIAKAGKLKDEEEE